MVGQKILCGACYGDPYKHSVTGETILASPQDRRYVGSPARRRCDVCKTVIPYAPVVNKPRVVVTLVQDCGHTRTWDVTTPKDRYSSRDMVECKNCGAQEPTSSIINKAELLAASLRR